MPYHMVTLDKFEILVSMGNAWIAMIIVVANISGYNDGEDFFGIILLVLFTPWALSISNYFVNY